MSEKMDEILELRKEVRLANEQLADIYAKYSELEKTLAWVKEVAKENKEGAADQIYCGL